MENRRIELVVKVCRFDFLKTSKITNQSDIKKSKTTKTTHMQLQIDMQYFLTANIEEGGVGG